MCGAVTWRDVARGCVQFRLLSPVTIKCWAIVVLRDARDLQQDGPGSLRRFGNCLVQTFTGMGITMPPVCPP
jgi:hypothetical protein